MYHYEHTRARAHTHNVIRDGRRGRDRPRTNGRGGIAVNASFVHTRFAANFLLPVFIFFDLPPRSPAPSKLGRGTYTHTHTCTRSGQQTPPRPGRRISGRAAAALLLNAQANAQGIRTRERAGGEGT
jgi:hypothetical protein